MERIPRQFYRQEFKEEAASLVENGGLTAAEASRRLSVSEQTLHKLIKKYRHSGKVSSSGRDVMDPKGNCWDNASMESLFGKLKTELVHLQKYRTRQEAIADIREYIEVFYNRQRRYAS